MPRTLHPVTWAERPTFTVGTDLDTSTAWQRLEFIMRIVVWARELDRRADVIPQCKFLVTFFLPQSCYAIIDVMQVSLTNKGPAKQSIVVRLPRKISLRNVYPTNSVYGCREHKHGSHILVHQFAVFRVHVIDDTLLSVIAYTDISVVSISPCIVAQTKVCCSHARSSHAQNQWQFTHVLSNGIFIEWVEGVLCIVHGVCMCQALGTLRHAILFDFCKRHAHARDTQKLSHLSNRQCG